MSLLAIALLLLPGLVVVRAPWAAVPALSLAFWTLSAWWPPFAGPGRSRVVVATLVTCFLLALLRLLPKRELAPPPGWHAPPAPPPAPRPGLTPPPLASAASLAVAVAALLLLGLALPWRHAPGPRLAFQTTMARVLVWRDGVPATAEPLLPLAPVGAHAPALATLAADLSGLTRLDPAPALLWVVTAAAGLLLLGLFSLHATWASPRAAALGALWGLAAAPWPLSFAVSGDGESLLALGFLLPSAALALGHASRASGAAAGMLLAAGALSQPLVAATGAFLMAGVARLVRPRRGARVAACAALALVFAGPGLLPLTRALSSREALAVLQSARPGELAALALGTGLACLAPLPLARLAGARARATALGLAVVAAAVLLARVHGWVASDQLPAPQLAALARAGAETDPLQPLCAPSGLRDWVPALAGRPPGEPGPWIPPVYADEWARRPRRPCADELESLLPRP